MAFGEGGATMSWNTSVLLAEGKSLTDMQRALPDVFLITKRSVVWEDASSAFLDLDVAIGELPGWGVLWTPNIQVTTFPEVLEAASRGGRALSVVLGGGNNVYGFCLYKDGTEVRRILCRRGSPIEQSGAPIPEEQHVNWWNAEDSLFGLARALTGINPSDFDTWSGVRFTIATLGIR
jgi:hypothetical protein